MSRIDEIKERLEAATPKPWDVAEWDDCPAVHFQILDTSGDYDHQYFVPQDQHYHTGPLADCVFIAHAPDDIDYLLAEIARYKRALELAATDYIMSEWGWINDTDIPQQVNRWLEQAGQV